jgi:hypothetical protein
MATFVNAYLARLAKCAGSYTEIAWGVDKTAGTSVTITVPQFGTVFGAISTSNSSTTQPVCDTPSGNTFNITKASGDVVTWIAFGTARY